MQHALKIPEILLNIFDHCEPRFSSGDRTRLAALARTCRTFKEPALDLLWRRLDDPSPLARCLPEASHYQKKHPVVVFKYYSFNRPLTQTEWDILRGYTCRVLYMGDGRHELDWESVRTFLNPPPSEPLFPNLRHICVGRSAKAKYLLSMPFPTLISFGITFADPEHLQGSQDLLESFCKSSPNIRSLSVSVYIGKITFTTPFFNCVCSWQNLQTVDCLSFPLDVTALAHLSRLPALARLKFSLTMALLDQISPLDSLLSFSNLRDFTLHSDSSDLIPGLLSRIRLPSITDFTVDVSRCRRKQDLSSFPDIVLMSCSSHTIQALSLDQRCSMYMSSELALAFEDLQPYMVFKNLRRVNLDTMWRVDLADDELLELASSWPHLEHLFINKWRGWRTQHGITPNGLVRLLQKCPSLSQIALAMDTRSYTDAPSLMNLGFTLPPDFSIDVLDSVIEPESVPAVAAFLAGIMPRPKFSFSAWPAPCMCNPVYEERWFHAYTLAYEAIYQRS